MSKSSDQETPPQDWKSNASFRDMASLWVQAQPALSTYINSIVWDAHSAEDVHQEVAQTVVEKFETYDRSRPFTPWAMGIARICIAKYLRLNQQSGLVIDERLVADFARELAQVEPELEQRKRALRQCIERLTNKAKRVVKLRYMGEMGTDEVAKETGMTRNSVRVTLHRARQLLSACIERALAGS